MYPSALTAMFIVFAAVLAGPAWIAAAEQEDTPIDISSRRELFVDRHLIDRLDGARLVLHHPQPREVSLTFDQPWERNVGYMTVFRDGGTYRLYYRGMLGNKDEDCATCYAESQDGVHWTRPKLGLFDAGKERGKANNIVWRGPPSLENMTPFRDDNPACPADQKYKAVGGVKWVTGGLWAFVSPDGIHWRKLGEKPLPLAGNFDSQNVVFWDAVRGEYRAYWRDHRRGDNKVPDGRDVRTAVSKDFITWSKRQWLDYDPSRSGATARDQTDDPSGDHHQFYTNGVQSYYRAPHLLLGFPQRYSDRGWTASTDALPGLEHRRKLAAKHAGGGRPTRDGTALTDVMLMASRDGQRFYVWPEAFVRPGIQRAGNWWYDAGCNWYTWGLVETSSPYEGAPPELSLYVTEKENAQAATRLRRHTLRLDGFASVHATLEGGQLVTRPLVFSGSRLEINFATSAAGSLRIEIQHKNGRPIPGFELAECQLQYGDQLDRVVSWKSGPDVSELAGKPIRLRVELKDADLYAMQFSQPKRITSDNE